ncbi:MAG: HNH endonuclease [Rhodopseudomonas sp.]|nr:HNH endonuclease [Rhodopseudomonas sp.]
MTGRSVPEWQGKTPDTPVPPRVRDRVFTTKDGRCHKCSREIAANRGETWTCEHMIALANGGENRESNLDVTCSWCLPAKNAEDVAEKSMVYRKRTKARGIKGRRRTIPGRRFDGTPIPAKWVD